MPDRGWGNGITYKNQKRLQYMREAVDAAVFSLLGVNNNHVLMIYKKLIFINYQFCNMKCVFNQ